MGIFKKYVSKNKIYFCLKKRTNASPNKKVTFVFHTIFKLDFIIQIIYFIIHRCLYSIFILFLFFYEFLPNEHRNNVNPSLFIQLAKLLQQNEWKKKPGVLEYDPEYVTGQINSCILELLLRWFCHLIFAPPRKNLNML